MSKEQKKNTKVLLFVIILIAVGIVVAMAIMNNRTENPQEDNLLMDFKNTENVKIDNGKKENNSTTLLADKTFKGMEVTEIRLSAENGITNFSAVVINNSGSDYAGGRVSIVFTNKDGSEYNILEGVIPAIKNGETNRINAGTVADLSNAYDVTFE